MFQSDALKTRFSDKERREKLKLWKVLCEHFFQRYIRKTDTVIDIGAGFCEFINNVSCEKKIALDLDPSLRKFASKDVEFVVSDIKKINKKYFGKTDVIFVSNLLEHLPTKDGVIEVLKISAKLLKKGGKIIILQPNIDLSKEKYWDRIDHYIPLNGASVIEALEISGFKIREYVKRFLPLTAQSRLPKWNVFVKLYLFLPPYLRPFSGQSLFVAVKK